MPLSGNKIKRVAIVHEPIHSLSLKRFRRHAESSDEGHTATNGNIAKILQLIKDGDEQMNLNDQYKSAILVLGNTGSGKSTFVQWIAEKDADLFSKEQAGDTGEYIIVDTKEKISNNTVESKTIFPELVIDNKTNIAYYDCPGFSDTRSAANDIAQTYFIKKLSGYLTKVKLVFVINHTSVTAGIDRQDFPNMLAQASALVRDIDKFEKSISLVVSKVVPPYNPKRRQVASDEKVMASIADFMKATKDYFLKRTTDSSLSDRERSLAASSIKFIDIFLIKSEGDYSRMSLFKRPDDDGPLDQIDSMVEGKKSVHRVLYNTLQYTEMHEDDFDYTVSDKSKNDVNALTAEIDNKIWSAVSGMIDKIKKHFNDSTDSLLHQLKSLRDGTATVDEEQGRDADDLLRKMATAEQIASSLAKNLSGAATDRLAEEMKQSIIRLKLPEVAKDLSNISSQGEFFKFLQAFSDTKFAARPWEDLFTPLKSYLTNLNQKLDAEIEQTSQNIRSKINFKIADVNDEMRKHYAGRFKVVPLQKLPSEFLKARRVIQEIDEPRITLVTAQRLLKRMEFVTSKLDINSVVIKKSVFHISQSAKRWRYIDKIIRSSIINQGPEWRLPFEDLMKYLIESETWYKFLGDLSKKLSSYDEQKNKTVYGGGTITKDSLRNFLLEIKKLNVEESKAVADMAATADRLEELNEVLDITLRSDVRISCRSDTLIVEGNFVKFSDFVGSNGKIEKRDCGESTKAVNIFALNKLFIDRHLKEVGGKMAVAALAPTWEVVSARQINLSGSDGKAHSTDAKEGGHGRKGDDGEAGLPGGSAGTFFGIASELFYSSWGKLNIFADGGKGAPGQRGGLGGNGTDGKSPSDHTYFYLGAAKCGQKCNSTVTITEFQCKQTCSYRQVYRDYSFADKQREKDVELRSCLVDVFGKKAIKGSNGGHGGKGGIGGRPGDVHLIITQTSSRPSISNREGNMGESGPGGEPGQGGLPANDVQMQCQPLEWLRTEWKFIKKQAHPPAGDGSPGLPGKSDDKQKEPKDAAVFSSLPRIVNDYKVYLRKNLKYHSQRIPLIEFLNSVENVDLVKSAYKTLDFIDEMRDLEEQSRNINFEREIVIPFYNSLMNRTFEYAKDPKFELDATSARYQQEQQRERQSQEHRKALAFLYTAILSKLHFLRADSEYTTITDIKAYLEEVESTIKTLSQTQEASNKFRVIDKYKRDYKSEIDKKVAEANHFIENQLEPEVKKVEKELDDNMDSLVKSILDSKNRAHQDVVKAGEDAAKLRQQMEMKMIFSGIKFASTIVKVAGPYGAAAGAAIDAATGIAEQFVFKKDDEEPDRVKVTQDAVKILSKGTEVWKTFKTEKINRLKKKIEAIEEKMSKVPKLREVSNELDRIKWSAANLEKDPEPDSSGLEGVEKIKKDLSIALEAKKKELEKDKKVPEGAVEILDDAKKVIDMADGLFDIYDKYKEGKKALETATTTLKTKTADVTKWESAEKDFYNEFTPFVKESQQEIKDVVDGLGAKSGVALQVQKWQIQNFLKKMRTTIKSSASDDAVVEGNMQGCVERLTEVITTLINIYDRIRDYQEQQKLGNYIADISSSSASGINVTDQALGRAVTELEVSIRSNLLLEQYHTAILTVKQWVFPFAHDYLVDFDAMLPSQLEIKVDDIRQLADKAKNHMAQVKKKVNNYKISIQKADKFIHHAIFDSDNVATRPFYVWKNGVHRDDITRLLSGDEVAFKADVSRSAADQDAIKFHLLEVNLRSSNETLQAELSEKLKHFRVSATHMGNSYYRYKNKFYVIASESLQIDHHFSRKDGEPVSMNSVYSKIKNGDIMFSPYAMWKIKLSQVTGKISFDDLMVYKDLVDLELEGRGSYIGDSDQIPDFNPGEYYELDENAFEIQNRTPSQSKHNVRRRSIAQPVSSSARRPVSWLNAFVSFGKQLISRLSEDHAYPVPSAVNDENDSINMQTNSLGTSDLLSIDQSSSGSSSTGLEMDNIRFNNTDVNGLLTWATLLARKWSGYRPRAIRTASDDASIDIELAIRSHELVDRFISRVEQFAHSRKIQLSGTISDHKLYGDCVSVVRRKLARGEDATVAALLVEIAGKAVWQLDQDDLDWLLSGVGGDLDDLNEKFSHGQVSPSMPCNGDQCDYITSLLDRESLRQHTSDLNSAHQALDMKLLPRNAFDESLTI